MLGKSALFRTATRSLSTKRHHRFSPFTWQLDLIGVPFAGGQPKGGVENAPEFLRKEGNIKEVITDLGWKYNDCGNISVPQRDSNQDKEIVGRVKNPRWVGGVNESLASAVEKSAQAGNFPLVIGGDHSIAVGTISGIQRVHPDIGVIWVDAHADINTTGSTPSGNLHGMPVSFLMGLTQNTVPGFEWLQEKGNKKTHSTDVTKSNSPTPVLGSDQLVYIGLRDLQTAEMDYLQAHNIKAFDMHEIDRYGIGTVMDWALKILGRDRPLHISFDIDSLDPKEAPSTGTPVRGGLTFREGAFLCEYVHRTERLVSMELVEVNPNLGSSADVDLTRQSGVSMIKAALGEALS